MDDPLTQSLQQPIRLQTQQLSEQRSRDMQEARQWSEMRTQFQQSIRFAPKEAHTPNTPQKMETLGRNFQHVLREMDRSLDHFAKDGEMQFGRLRQSFSRILTDMIREMIQN